MNAEENAIFHRLQVEKELLASFGARLYGMDPGVVFIVTPEDDHHPCYVDLDSAQWAWVRPLLVELKARREGTWVEPELGSSTEKIEDPPPSCKMQNPWGPEAWAVDRAAGRLDEKGSKDY